MSSVIELHLLCQLYKHGLANKYLGEAGCTYSKECPQTVWYSLLSNWQTTFGTPDTIAQSVLSQHTTERSLWGHRRPRRHRLLSHLSSLQYTHHFPLPCDLKLLCGNEFSQVTIMLSYDLQQESECGAVARAPVPAMWNCCAWIHRGAV